MAFIRLPACHAWTQFRLAKTLNPNHQTRVASDLCLVIILRSAYHVLAVDQYLFRCVIGGLDFHFVIMIIPSQLVIYVILSILPELTTPSPH